MKKRYKRLGSKSKKFGSKGKKGQIMGMSFQFIFSVILIAFALFISFWAIKHFMSVVEMGKILSYKDNFENRVESIWASAYEVETNYSFDLSSKIKWVCFAIPPACSTPSKVSNDLYIKGWYPKTFCEVDYENYNMFLLPLGMAEKCDAPSAFKITCKGRDCLEFGNPLCIPVKDGKIKIKFVKNDKNPGKIQIFDPDELSSN